MHDNFDDDHFQSSDMPKRAADPTQDNDDRPTKHHGDCCRQQDNPVPITDGTEQDSKQTPGTIVHTTKTTKAIDAWMNKFLADNVRPDLQPLYCAKWKDCYAAKFHEYLATLASDPDIEECAFHWVHNEFLFFMPHSDEVATAFSVEETQGAFCDLVSAISNIDVK